jgi:myo-inositol-1(or 4)-monophosphatase
VDVEHEKAAGPVTEADLKVDALLRDMLPQDGEGWLSEETADNPARLGCRRVWVVDPIDGTKEFVRGRPEWCVSVGLVEDGIAVAGGILNPETDQLLLGSLETGVTLNGGPVHSRECDELEGAVVLASRSEYGRGEWEFYEGLGFVVQRMGSVAWKLALVAAGKADATWTLKPKNEWDVVAGVALVHAAGGTCFIPWGGELGFNRPDPKLRDGLAACAPGVAGAITELLAERE